MKRLLLMLVMVITSIGLSAADWPTKGQVVYFDFNGTLKEKYSGKQLKVVNEQTNTLEALKTPKYVQGADGDKALVIDNKPLATDIDISATKYPDMTMVVRLKVDSLKAVCYVLAPRYSLKEYSLVLQRSIFLTKSGKVSVKGYADKESGRLAHIASEQSLVSDDYITVIATFKAKGQERQVAVGGEVFSFVADREKDDTQSGSYLNIGDRDYFHGAVDQLAVYDRILTQEEIEQIVGGKVEIKEFKSSDKGGFPWGKLSLVMLVLYLPLVGLWYWIYRSRKLYPIIDGEYMNRYPKPHDIGQTKVEAMEWLAKARSYWNWQEMDGQIACNYPEKRGWMKKSREAFDMALATGCEDADILVEYNKFAAVYNEGMQYSFRGYAWVPLATLLAMLAAFFGYPLIDGDGNSAGILLIDTFVSLRALFFYISIFVYLLVCLCPKYIARKGMMVDDTDSLLARIKEGCGSVGALTAGATAGAVGMIFSGISSGLRNSTENYKVYVNGHFSHHESRFNPLALFQIFGPIIIVGALALIVSVVVLILTMWAPFVRMFINYVVKK